MSPLKALFGLYRKYPMILLGYGIKRWERMKMDQENGTGPIDEYWDKSGLTFWLDRSSQNWGPTHLQKKSRCGFLITWPFCFHIWFTFRYQQQDSQGTWIPGSEIVFYWRPGMWRWDSDAETYMPWAWYGPGLHWD